MPFLTAWQPVAQRGGGGPGRWLRGLVAALSIHVPCLHSPCLFEKLRWEILDLLCISVFKIRFPFHLRSSLSLLVFPYTCSWITIMFYLLFRVINLHVICTASIDDKTLSFLSLLPFKFFCFVSEAVKFPYLHFLLGKYLGFQRGVGGLQNRWPEIVLGVSWLLNGLVLLNPHLMVSKSISSMLPL